MSEHHSYLLVDTALICGPQQYFDPLPEWAAAIYKPEALSVTPLLIDLGAAVNSGATDIVMSVLNAKRPQLHASIITSVLNLNDLAQHFRRFVFARSGSADLTLRFADCMVLWIFERHLHPEQWAALTSPVSRWCCHRMEGNLEPLRIHETPHPLSGTPLEFSHAQFEQIMEASRPTRMHSQVALALAGELPGTYAMQIEWITSALRIAEKKSVTNEAVLIALSSGAVQTKGELLTQYSTSNTLTTNDPKKSCPAIWRTIENFSN